MSETGINIILGILVVGALALTTVMKWNRSAKSPLGRVYFIMMNINHNEKLVENFGAHRGTGRMKTGAWRKNKDNVDFLPLELRMTLDHAFEMSEEVNGRIDAAKKFKSDSYMAGIDVSKLREPLAKSKEQLREWLQENAQNPEYQPKKKRSLFG